jgi:NAD(P)-dependent dehydrogenase (short-subunit alcohol dehydrogenase family)
MSLFSLEGKVALVTGGAQGLGRMIAEGLLNAGARVYITSRKADVCHAAAAELGPECHALPGDAGTPEGIIDIVAAFRAAGEQALNVLVNNAGRTWGAPIESFPDRAWPGVMAVNVQAPFRIMQECLPLLSAAALPNDPARVINIGSVASSVVNDLNAYSYVASKAALQQLSKQVAADLVDRNITVNTITPGFFPTSMTSHMRDEDHALEARIPMKRLGAASDIAGVSVFLSSRASAYVTGIDLAVDGGLSGAQKVRFS